MTPGERIANDHAGGREVQLLAAAIDAAIRAAVADDRAASEAAVEALKFPGDLRPDEETYNRALDDAAAAIRSRP